MAEWRSAPALYAWMGVAAITLPSGTRDLIYLAKAFSSNSQGCRIWEQRIFFSVNMTESLRKRHIAVNEGHPPPHTIGVNYIPFHRESIFLGNSV